MSPFVSLTRHSVTDITTWLPAAREALAPLASQPGCLGSEIGAAIDDPSLMIVLSHWESVGAYRRALSAFDVKARSIPFLSTAIDEPSAFEVLHRNAPNGTADYTSARAADADSVRLGESAGEHIPPRA